VVCPIGAPDQQIRRADPVTAKINRQAAPDDHLSAGAHGLQTGSDLHLGRTGGQWPKIDNSSATGGDQLIEHRCFELRTTVEELG
jgi:hypothetical protein